MTARIDAGKRDGHGARAGYGFWAMVACCVPMIVILALIALKVV